MDLELPREGEFQGNEYLTECPRCGSNGKRKFSFNILKQVGRCFHCETTVGSLKAYKKLHEDCVFEYVYGNVEAPVDEETLPLDLAHPMFYREADEYLKQRRVYSFYDMRYSPRNQSLYIPLTPVSPELPDAWQTRKIYGSSYWRNMRGFEKSKYVYGPVSDSHIAILVEGVFDLLTPQLYGLGHALLGSKISEEQAAFLAQHYTTIILWLDYDRAGNLGDVQVKEILESWGLIVGVKKTPCDPGSYHDNDWLRKLRSQLSGKDQRKKVSE